MIRDVILVDLDDTLAAAWRREHLIEAEGWDAFHSQLGDDDPIHDLVAAVNALHGAAFHIIGLTARPEKWRTATMAWMVKHDLHLHELLMRPDADFTKSPVVKVAVAAERLGGVDQIKARVAFIIDDRQDVCEAFAALGVTALQVYARRD